MNAYMAKARRFVVLIAVALSISASFAAIGWRQGEIVHSCGVSTNNNGGGRTVSQGCSCYLIRDRQCAQKTPLVCAEKPQGDWKIASVSIWDVVRHMYFEGPEKFRNEIGVIDEYIRNRESEGNLSFEEGATFCFYKFAKGKVNNDMERFENGKLTGGGYYYAHQLATKYAKSCYSRWARQQMIDWKALLQ